MRGVANGRLSPAGARRWAVGVILLGVLLVTITIFRTSITDDEPYFHSYGRRILFQGSFARLSAIDGSKLPVVALNAAASWAAHLPLLHELAHGALTRVPLTARERAYIRGHGGLYAGRFVTVLFYAATCVLVFSWGMQVYGPAGALGATTLIAALPTLLGHSGLVTVDAAATCTMLFAVFTLVRWSSAWTLRRALAAGFACGLALLVKYSALGLVPIALAIVAVQLTAGETGRERLVWRAAGGLLLVGIVALAVVSAGFAFQHPVTSLSDLASQSRLVHRLHVIAGDVPLPLPKEFLAGLDTVLAEDQERSGGGATYLLGTLSEQGRWSYYVVALFLKTPLPFLLLLAARPWRRERVRTDVLWLIPIAWLLGHMSFTLNTQIGIRHVLPIFPFLALLAGACWDATCPIRLRRAATALAFAALAEAVSSCPRYLSYFNAVVGNERNAYRYLADSNLDWNQGRFALWRWEDRQSQPYVVDPRYLPSAGLVVVRATEFVGIFDPGAYAWLRTAERTSAARLVDVIDGSLLVFEVDPRHSPQLRAER